MAVTAFQAEILKRIARSRIDGGETYIAGGVFKGYNAALEAALAAGELEFHKGTIGGAWPRIIG